MNNEKLYKYWAEEIKVLNDYSKKHFKPMFDEKNPLLPHEYSWEKIDSADIKK